MSTRAKALLDGAMQGYQFVDGIYKDKQAQKERKEDRDKQNDAYESQKKFYETKNQGLEASALFEKMKDPNYKLTDNDHQTINDLNIELDTIEGTQPEINLMTDTISSFLSGSGGDINTPEFLGAFNKEFSRKINRDYKAQDIGEADDGVKVLKKEVAFIMPGKEPGTVLMDLLITGEKDGKPVQYRAPATIGRSTDPNDNVRQIPVEMILNDLQTRSLLANNPEMLNQVRSQLKGIMVKGGIPIPKSYGKVKTIGGQVVQEDSEGKIHTIGGGRGGSIKLPADQQMIEYYMNALKMPQEEAVALVNSKNSRTEQELASDIYLAKLRAGGQFAGEEERAIWLQEAQQEAKLLKGGQPDKPADKQGNAVDKNTIDSYIQSKL